MALITLNPNTAMIGMDPEADDYSIKNVFPRRGETGTSQEIIDLLPTRSA
jgi:hypothetical protein